MMVLYLLHVAVTWKALNATSQTTSQTNQSRNPWGQGRYWYFFSSLGDSNMQSRFGTTTL